MIMPTLSTGTKMLCHLRSRSRLKFSRRFLTDSEAGATHFRKPAKPGATQMVVSRIVFG